MSYLSIDNHITIRYESIDGSQDKSCLVFIHEGLGCIEMWKEFPRQLCELTGCAGLLYDRSGYGKSSPLTRSRDINYVHDYALIELPRVIEALIPQRDYLLIGHSDGASIALIHGAQPSPRLRGLVVEAPHVFVEDETLRGISLAKERHNRYGLGGLLKYHGDNAHAVFNAWSETWLAPWFREWNIEAILPDIGCPVLAIQGENDAYGTVRQLDVISRLTETGASHILKDCGHSPHREQAAETLRLISEFIRTLHPSH